jgi:nucleoside-diphosphate-sugar epimerase
LLDRGHEVVCVDNLISGELAHIEHVRSHPRFRFIEHDISTPLELDAADAVFHLASPASPNPDSTKSYIAHPIETALANSLGTHRLLGLALRLRATFLFASTSEAYGDPLEHPQKETYWGNVNPNGIRSCYDESKRFGEALTMAYLRTHDLDARIVRIFNTYGPRCDVRDGRVVPAFIGQALAGQPLTIQGDGFQTRSLCYVSDLVEGLWRAMTHPRTRGEVINLGNPEEHTVLEYANLIRQLCDSSSEIVHEPPRPDDPTRRRPDITKATALLDWTPQVPLTEGLTRTIDWCREQPE